MKMQRYKNIIIFLHISEKYKTCSTTLPIFCLFEVENEVDFKMSQIYNFSRANCRTFALCLII